MLQLSIITVGDYTPITMTVVFASGQTTATVDVPITNDMVLEEDEVFTATLMSQEPNVIIQDANSNADITIFDDDRKFSQAQREPFTSCHFDKIQNVVGNTVNYCFFPSHRLLL